MLWYVAGGVIAIFQKRTETQKVLPTASQPVSTQLGFQLSEAWVKIPAQSNTTLIPLPIMSLPENPTETDVNRKGDLQDMSRKRLEIDSGLSVDPAAQMKSPKTYFLLTSQCCVA